MMQAEPERISFFEDIKAQAETEYAKDPKNAAALTRIAGALLELAHFNQGEEASAMIKDATEKLQKSLELDNQKHETWWCLGNGYTSQGFLEQEEEAAGKLFDEASTCFKKAIELDPGNEVYKKTLEFTKKAPQLFQELQKQIQTQGPSSSAGPQSEPGAGLRGDPAGQMQSKGKQDNEFWWDVSGWVMFTAIIAGIAFLSKNAPPPVMAQAMPPPAK